MANQFFIIFISFFYIKFLSSSQAETHTLTQGQNLSDSQYLISPSNIFVLGFFNPSSSAKSRYLGIWYSGRDSDAVWVANRDNPIRNSTGKLTIDGDGNLKILFDGGHLMDLYNQSRTSNKITATLQDDGNFVLKDHLNGTEDRILWQSFDSPTDTLLPGMKLGINFKTGQKWSLNAWLAKGFPTTGIFTLAGDPNGTSELIIWRREKIYWRSGVWNNDKQSFERALELTSDKRCDFRYVSNENEKYVTYSMKKSDADPYDTRWVMDPRGALGFSEEGTIGPCQGKTGSRETLGCVWEISLSDCGRGDEFQFQERNGEIYAYNLNSIQEMRNSSLGFPDCEAICRQNCSCLAFTYYRDDVTLCQFYSGVFKFQQTKGGRVFYVDPSLLPSSSVIKL